MYYLFAPSLLTITPFVRFYCLFNTKVLLQLDNIVQIYEFILNNAKNTPCFNARGVSVIYGCRYYSIVSTSSTIC